MVRAGHARLRNLKLTQQSNRKREENSVYSILRIKWKYLGNENKASNTTCFKASRTHTHTHTVPLRRAICYMLIGKTVTAYEWQEHRIVAHSTWCQSLFWPHLVAGSCAGVWSRDVSSSHFSGLGQSGRREGGGPVRSPRGVKEAPHSELEAAHPIPEACHVGSKGSSDFPFFPSYLWIFQSRSALPTPP
jgi:hypothetical protein